MTGIVITGGTVSEDDDVGVEVATLAAVDEDTGDVYSYGFVTGLDGATPTNHDFFDIVGNKIVLNASLDDEDIGSYKVFVKATTTVNGQPQSVVTEVTLTVTDEVETEDDSDRGNKVTGTSGADVINGNGGNDKIYGLAGDDTLNGGTGSDTLWGDAGNDVLNGGLGKDKLYGGLGQDTFVFNTPVKKGHFDQIMDFKPSDDTIQISLAALKAFKVKGPKTSDVQSKKGADDDKGKPDDKGGGRPDKGSTKSVGFDKIFKKGQKLEKKFFNVGTKLDDAPDGSNDYVFYNKKNGFVYLDVDGSGKGKGIEILKVKPGTMLTADDFLFI